MNMISSLKRQTALALYAFLILIIINLIIPFSVFAFDFYYGDVEGMFDVTLAYGLITRLHPRDKKLLGLSNGGESVSVNADDGDLNYNEGLAYNMFKATGELELKWHNFGAFARGYAFYDYENNKNSQERTQLSREARELIGRDAEILDAYLVANAEINKIPVQIRLGDQILNWGESAIIRGGINIINPVDLNILSQPVSTLRDSFIPLGMLWGVANVTELMAVEGFYQYDWEPTRLPPVGSYFSTSDSAGKGGEFIVLGSGKIFEQGVDLDNYFKLSKGTLGFDPNFMKLFRSPDKTPKDSGQYGMTIQAIIPELNAAKIALHFVNYHSRLMVLNARTPNQNAVNATSPDAVKSLTGRLAPAFSKRFTPQQAEAKSFAAAQELTLSQYLNNTRYFFEYPEDIQMIGFSFNTTTIHTGTLIAGEISCHLEMPLQIDTTQLLTAASSPIAFNPAFKKNQLGVFGANQTIKGYIERDMTQAVLNLTQLFGARLGASQSIISAEAGWIHVNNMPNKKNLLLGAPGTSATDRNRHFPDANSWGYRAVGQLLYTSVLGGLNLSPRIVWSHDVNGVTPGPVGTFLEERKTLSFGLQAELLRDWTADVSYTNFLGAGRHHLINDRDFIALNFKYSF
jgi:hypothetical protein